jgi:hypothetical protein
MRRLFGGCVGTLHGYSSRVVAGIGLLCRFIACAVLCVAKLIGEIASADISSLIISINVKKHYRRMWSDGPHPPNSAHFNKPSATQSRWLSRYGHIKAEVIYILYS